MPVETHMRAEVQWVPITDVIPNPLNPRKNDAIKTEEMQQIILNKGWEIPLTVYKKGKFFVVLSGHRRLYAAKQTRSIKEIPVYVVSAPENHQEEIERIASLQRGQVDWSPYEWAKFSYERWIAWGKPSYKEFSKRTRIPQNTVAEYIQVMEYYPRFEIESKLESKVFSMSSLSSLVDFINKLKIKKTELVSDLTEDMIRQALLAKMENKLIPREVLRRATSELIDVISDEDFLRFLTTSNMSLQDALDEHGIELKKKKTFQGRLISMGIARKNIDDFPTPYKKEEQEQVLKSLQNLQDAIEKKKKEIKKLQAKL